MLGSNELANEVVRRLMWLVTWTALLFFGMGALLTYLFMETVR